MSKSLADALLAAAEGADVTAHVTRGATSTIAKLTSVALRFGAEMAERGKDPVVEITRMLSSKPDVNKVHDKWDEFIEANFRPASHPPPPSDTQPAAVSKHDTEPSMPAIADDDIYDDED